MKRGLVMRRDCRWGKSLVAMLVLVLTAGCGKVPTWGELTGQQPATPPPTTPSVVQPSIIPTPVTPVLPPKPNAAEVIARFKALRPAGVSDSSLAELASLTEGLEDLTEIDATNSSVSDGGLTHLAKLPFLKKLDLVSTKVTDQGMRHLAHVPSLETLTLQGTAISDTGVATLNTLPNLKELDLRQCQLTPEGFAAIGRMPVLESIHLDNTGGLNDTTFDLICNARTLKRLYMNYVGGITDNGMRSLSKLEILEELYLNECPVTCEALIHVAKSGLKNLKKLSVHRCPITLAGAKAINLCKSLEYLNVGGIGMDDKGLVILTQGLTNLKILHLNECKNVTGSGFTAIKNASNLEILTLVSTSVVDQALPLLKGHKNLKKLDLSNTKVSAAAVQALKNSLPDCEIIP